MTWQTERARIFPKDILAAAQASERATGVRACVTLAQWALESAYGRYKSGKFNFFGIKGKPGTLCKTWEVYGGKTVIVYASFKDFPSLAAAFTYHGKMLANPLGYYRKALPLRKDWRAYIKAIAPIYATDPAYASKLIGIVERFHLYDYNLSA